MFKGAEDGEIAFVALSAFLDVRYGRRDAIAAAEFTFEDLDEGDRISRRRWASLRTAGRLVGHVYRDEGEDSGFVCEPA